MLQLLLNLLTQTANRSEAKERSQNHTSASASASTQSNQKSSAGNSGISSKMEGYGTEKKYRGPDGGMYTAKEADNAGWTPGYYDEGAGGAKLVGKVDPKQAKLDENEAYRQSRLDIQAHKAEFGPKNVYGMQSARDTHERSMARGNPKVTGPQRTIALICLQQMNLLKRFTIVDTTIVIMKWYVIVMVAQI